MNENMIDKIEKADAELLSEAGIVAGEENRSGSFILRDFRLIYMNSKIEGLEILPIKMALEKYNWLEDKYYWKAVKKDTTEYTKQMASADELNGVFIRIAKGAKVTIPCQAGFYMTSNNLTQMVHNVIIVEDDAELNIITGCMSGHNVNSGQHMSIEEQYIGKNAKLTSTMIHGWGSDVKVYPHAGTIIEDGGRYENNYVSLRSPKSIVSNPITWLNGKKATAKYLTIILSSIDSVTDVGGDIYMNGEDSSAELAHRGVCIGGTLIQKGLLIGNAKCRAHVDCAGMLLNKNGSIESVPGLKTYHEEARMSHEASIGKIAPDQVEYLQSRGMDERDAISMLIRGFLGADIVGLGVDLDKRIAEIAEIAGHGEE